MYFSESRRFNGGLLRMGGSLRSLVQVLRRMKNTYVSNGTGYRISGEKILVVHGRDEIHFEIRVHSSIAFELRFRYNISRMHDSPSMHTRERISSTKWSKMGVFCGVLDIYTSVALELLIRVLRNLVNQLSFPLLRFFVYSLLIAIDCERHVRVDS